MRVTIDLSDEDVKILGRWASVHRTLSQAVYLLTDIHNEDTLHCAGEISEISQSLDRVHRQVREEIRKQGGKS